MEKDIKRLAVFIHNTYEKIAKKENWKTKKNCMVSFNKLPKENKQTMLKTAEEIFKWFRKQGFYSYDNFFNFICFPSKLFGEDKIFNFDTKK